MAVSARRIVSPTPPRVRFRLSRLSACRRKKRELAPRQLLSSGRSSHSSRPASFRVGGVVSYLIIHILIIMIQKIFCGAFCFRCGLDRMELLMRSLCSLVVSDSLRSCTLRLANEFALLTTLFICVLVLTSCSQDLVFARVSQWPVPPRTMSSLRSPYLRRWGEAESYVSGRETREDSVISQLIPLTPGAITPHLIRSGRRY